LSVTIETKMVNIARAILSLKEEMVSQRAIDNKDNYSKKISEDLKVWRQNLIDIYAQSPGNLTFHMPIFKVEVERLLIY
jgi:rsbT co-antagonist protein RsbR